MKLLLDEMHAPRIADAVTDRAWDVVAVAAEPELRGMPDEELLETAAAMGRCLVTENVADFVPILTAWSADNRSHPGVIFTNPRRFNRATLAYPGNLVVALRRFVESPPISGDSWVWWLELDTEQ